MFSPYKNYRYLRRYQQIITTVARHGFGDLVGRLNLFALLKLKRSNGEVQTSKAMSRGVRFRLMLEQLGPTFIKLGQILSTRPDLLPSDIVVELANLQDGVTATGWAEMQKGLSRDDLEILEESFGEFDTDPIASASIAQVYRARLRSGEDVAVKIIRAGTEKMFRDDMIILEHLAGLVQTHVAEARQWNTKAIVSQLRNSIDHELDLQHEGRNADIFRGNFSDDPTVYVPKIYWEHSSRHVLVMEFVDGRPMAEFFADGVDPAIRKELASNGARIVLRQVFEHGFFQADPHPGNAFVMNGGVICFLDFGMFGRLDQKSLEILGRVLYAVSKRDIDRLFRAARDLGVLPPEDNPELKLAVLDLLEQYHGLPLKQIDMRQLFRDIIQLVSRFHIGVRHDFLFLIKAIGTIESTGRKLDPDFDMMSHIGPFVRKMLGRRFSPQSILEDSQRFAEDVSLLARETPEHFREILRQVRLGQAKLEFHHKGLERPMADLNRMSDKLILGIIIGALIIASSLMAHADIGPSFLGFPVIGSISFLIAGVTGLWIVFDILRSRKK